MLKILEVLIAALRDDSDDEIDVSGITLEPEDLCEDDAGNVVTVNTMVLAILTGTVRGYLYDPDGVPLRYGRARRPFSRDQGDAIRARFRRCNHPYGCGCTGARLQSNHVTEHRHGGNTDIDNGDPRCGPHNRWHTNTFGRPPPDGPVDRDQRRLPPDLGHLDFTQLPIAPLRGPHLRPKLRRGYRWVA